MNQPDDALLERYAEAVAKDARQPAARVRDAVHAHAQMLVEKPPTTQSGGIHPAQHSANQSNWSVSLVASIAVVGLASVMFLQIDSSAPQDREVALGAAKRSNSEPVTDLASATPIDKAQSTVSAAGAAHRDVAPSATDQGARVVARPAVAAPRAQTQAPQTTMGNAAEPNVQLSSAGEVDAPPPKPVGAAVAPIASTDAIRNDSKKEARSLEMAAPAMRARSTEPHDAPSTAQFFDAARSGQVDALEKLLNQGVSVNARDDIGNTALMVAVVHRQSLVLRKLLDRGANVALVNREGLTAQQLAARLGSTDMVKMLQTPQ